MKFKDFTKVVKKCLKNAKLDKVKVEDLSVVMDCFDVEGSGMFAYEEFVCYLEYLGESKVLRQLKSKLRAKLTTSKSLKLDENDSEDEMYKNKRKALHKSFKKFDSDDTGFVTLKNFEKRLKKLMDIEKDEISLLVDALDADKNGKISYTEFATFVFPDRSIDKIVRTLRASLKSAIKHRGGENAIKDMFDDIDTDGDNKISCDEFLIACIDYQFPLDVSIIHQIMLRYDSNNNGSIDPSEFLSILDESEEDDDSHVESENDSDAGGETDDEGSGALLTKSIKKKLWEGGKALAIKEKTSARTAVIKVFKSNKATQDDGTVVKIEKKKFFEVLKDMKVFKLRQNDFEKIANAFSIDDSGSLVDVTEFAAFVVTPADDFGRDGKYIKKVAEKLHKGIDKEFEVQKAKKKGKYKTSYAMLKELFPKHGNGNKKKGTIPGDRLERVLGIVAPSVTFEENEIDALKRRFIVKGTIHYMDFIYFIDPQPDVEKLIKKLRVKVKIMERRGKNIEAIFEEADADNSNALSYTEFSKLLKSTCGLPLTDAQVRALIKRLDIDDDDEIDHFEFLDLVLPEEEEEVEPQVTKDKKQKQEKKKITLHKVNLLIPSNRKTGKK